jgi:hypothetical protein
MLRRPKALFCVLVLLTSFWGFQKAGDKLDPGFLRCLKTLAIATEMRRVNHRIENQIHTY